MITAMEYGMQAFNPMLYQAQMAQMQMQVSRSLLLVQAHTQLYPCKKAAVLQGMPFAKRARFDEPSRPQGTRSDSVFYKTRLCTKWDCACTQPPALSACRSWADAFCARNKLAVTRAHHAPIRLHRIRQPWTAEHL